MLWRKIGGLAGIDKQGFDRYFKGAALGYGILFDEVWSFEPAIQRSAIKQRWPDFRPPQLYHYLTEAEARRLGVKVLELALVWSE